MTTRNGVLALYRAFLRQAKGMERKAVELEVRRPIAADSWGSSGYGEAGLAYQASTYAALLGRSRLHSYPGAERLDARGLRRVVRDNWEAHRGAAAPEVPRLMSDALSALRVLLEQLYLHSCSSSAETNGVRIDATSQFTARGDMYAGRTQNLFSYRLRVINNRPERVQVLGREWSIKNDAGKEVVRVPYAPNNAIVGQMPIIPPGECFEYVSGTDLDTNAGLQRGGLRIKVLEGAEKDLEFTAEVAPFAHRKPEGVR